MRWMHVRFFGFAIDRLTRSREDGKRALLALSRTERSRDLVVALSPAAAERGLRLGQTAAAARAIESELEIRPFDESGDRQALEDLAEAYFRFSPDLVLDPQPSSWDHGAAGLFVEISRTAKLLGGEEAVLEAARSLAQGLGYRAAVACTPRSAASRALTWSRPEVALRLSEAELEPRLARLPWQALEPDRKTAERLRLLGLATLGDLGALPRAGARARLGAALTDRLELVLGRQDEARERFRPCERFVERTEWWPPVFETSSVLFASKRLFEAIAARLTGRAEALAEARLRIGLSERGASHDIVLRPSRPTARADVLQRLLHHRLENLELTDAAESLELEVLRAAALEEEQIDLFGEAVRRDWRDETLELVDRLAARLGVARVATPGLVADHRPERAVRWRRPGRPAPRGPDAEPVPPPAGRRPFLLDEPRWLFVAEDDRQHPIEITRGRGQGSLRILSGPERIASGWWDGRDVQRRYFEIETEAGERWWIYRDDTTGAWFRQGLFA